MPSSLSSDPCRTRVSSNLNAQVLTAQGSPDKDNVFGAAA